MAHLKTWENKSLETSCLGCTDINLPELANGQIYRSDLWNISQDIELNYPGLIVLAPLRHISAVADLTATEWMLLQTHLKQLNLIYKTVFQNADILYFWGEKQRKHLHFVVLPLHDLVPIRSRAGALQEIIQQAENLRKNTKIRQKTATILTAFKNGFAC